MKDEVSKILKEAEDKLCVISTSNKEGKPEGAVMGYAVEKNLDIIMSTSNESRKYKNIKDNSQVSITFGFTFGQPNIQYDGIATLVEKGDSQFTECEDKYFEDHPESIEYKGTSDTIFIKIKPQWVRVSDYNTEPAHIEELVF